VSTALDRLRSQVMDLEPDDLRSFIATLDPDDLELIEHVLAHSDHVTWTPLPHQVPPPTDASWFLWLLMGGRGTGKTDGCAHAMDEHVDGPPCFPGVPGGHRMAIIAPTLGDASEACVNGPSGLRAHNPAIREVTRKGGTIVVWPGGAEAKLFGAYTKEDIERLRAGGNRCFAWCEELAAWRYLRGAWNNLVLGLRLGPAPRAIASTTPRNRQHLRKLLAAPSTVVSHGSTNDNPHLDPDVRQRLYETYSGTRLAAQELEGKMLEDVEGALWSPELIESVRLGPTDGPLAFQRIVIGVDPSWGTMSDECGIVAAGQGVDGKVYVLGDYSCIGGPAVWGPTVADAFHTLNADIVVAEANFHGEQVRQVMESITDPRGKPAYKPVTASRGKAIRAEPVVMAYEQSRVWHLGRFPLLEQQLTTWVPGAERDDDDSDGELVATQATEHEGAQDDARLASDWSPDRLDALVWAVTELVLGIAGPASLSVPSAAKLPEVPINGNGAGPGMRLPAVQIGR
jgi:phage terminase large subunit-like protein